MAAKTPLQHGGHHVVSTSTSVAVLVILAALMALTIGASYLHMPVVAANVLAMAIAAIKASLVMTYFMGLKWASKLTRFWAAAGFVTFILMFIILFDYNSRSAEVAPGWNDIEGPAMPRTVDPTNSHKMPAEDQINFQLRQQG